MSNDTLPRGMRPVHPGELLREDVLPAFNRAKAEIARLLGVSRQTLYDILAERQPVTPSMALRIGKLTGTTPESWVRMQASYDLARARLLLGEGLDAIPTPSSRLRGVLMAEGWSFPKGELMRGKKGLVMGVANDKSIAWGIASQLAAQGAELAFTYMGEGLERRVRPLAESIGVKLLAPADVTDDASMEAAFAQIEREFGTLDFLVHSVAFANKDELKGSFVENTTREGFLTAMNISVFSFVDAARRAARLMPDGGSIVTMTFLGSERVIPNYNTMGVAKAALEAATRYIARDLGPQGVRVNAISAGAMRTLSLAGIAGGRGMLSQGRAFSALKEDTSMEGVGGAALWLLSDLGRSTTGEVVHVDAGFHMIGLPDEAAAEG